MTLDQIDGKIGTLALLNAPHDKSVVFSSRFARSTSSSVTLKESRVIREAKNS